MNAYDPPIQQEYPCQFCGGDGSIEVEVECYIPECCGNYLPSGECCGNAIQGVDIDLAQEICHHCNGTGVDQ